MMRDREQVADDLRDQAQDELTRQGVLDMLRESVEIATSDDDPFDHPMTIRAANFEQAQAVDQVLAAMRRYMNATQVDDAAIKRRLDAIEAERDAA